MTTTPLIMIDMISRSFDEAGIKVAPVVTFEFQNDMDLHRFLDQFNKTLAGYAKNAIVAPITKDEVNRFNDVFIKFTVR